MPPGKLAACPTLEVAPVFSPQNVVGTILVTLLAGLSVYFAWRQGQTLRGLRHSREPLEDRHYLRNQAWRRLVGCGLMVCAGLLLAGWFVLGFEDLTNQLAVEA